MIGLLKKGLKMNKHTLFLQALNLALQLSIVTEVIRIETGGSKNEN